MSRQAWPHATSPFHAGEQAVQTRAGVREMAEHIGRATIRPAMPEQHRDFFEELPYVVVAAVDPEGRPWASMLVGVPGFIQSPDERTLVIEARPVEGDPLARALVPGARVGLLGIQLETRRRNRANGTLRELTSESLTIDVDESVGNCPQYIQVREIEGAVRRSASVTAEGARLSSRARAIVRAADTLFLGSGAPRTGDATGGADVSHRGGKPGFVRVADEDGRTVLTLPDFSGNNMYMTLGNLSVNPRAAMVIVDFDEGALLSLTGTTEIVWDGPEVAAFAGAERLVRFTVERGVVAEGAIPFRWSKPEYAKQLARTGEW